MKALVYTAPEKLDYRDVPDPEPRDEVVVRVAHVGICGSDLHAWAGHDERRPAPLVLGHEAAGEVVAGPTPGRRVAVNPLVTCGACQACQAGRENLCAARQILSMPPRDGAFAERVTVPQGNLVDIPDNVPTAKAALVEPLACGWHAVRLARAALDRPLGEARCLVYGGGAIGLGAALILVAEGASEVYLAEPSAARRSVLAKAGDIRAFDPSDGGPSVVDLVVDGVGVEATRRAASAATRPGGVIAHIGLGSATGGLDVRRLTLQEIAFLGSYTYTARDFRDTARAMFEGNLGALDWQEIRPLADGARAFADIRARRVAAPKIVLEP